MNNFANKKILPVGEWLAENAYIAPGKHRLLTATGLMAGLYAGRTLMNTLTGQDRNGNHIDKSQVAPPLQPFHGILEYNKYDDSPDAKWHKVIDSFIPIIIGAAGAMAGSSIYCRNTVRILGNKTHNPMFAGLTAELEKIAQGKSFYTLQTADMEASLLRSTKLNRPSGMNYQFSTTAGNHLFPNPFAQSVNAFRFQFAAGKDSLLPGRMKYAGNYGQSSRRAFGSLKYMMTWIENQVAHYGSTAWQKENDYLSKMAQDALKVFQKDFKGTEVETKMAEYLEERIASIKERAEKVREETGLDMGEELLKALRKDTTFQRMMNDSFWGKGLHKQYEKLGLWDPSKPEEVVKHLGDYGFVSKTFDLLPGWGRPKAVYEKFVKAWRDGEGKAKGAADMVNMDDFTPGFLWPAAAGIAAVGGVAAVGISGSTKQSDCSTPDDEELKGLPRCEAAKRAHEKYAQHGKGIAKVVNGAPLDLMHWLSNVLVVPPGLHRFMNAAMLSTFLVVGAKVSGSLAARDIRGNPLTKDQVWAPLRPLFGKMEYVWTSQKLENRWKRVAHQLLPVAIGAGGTYTGSRLYFQDRLGQAQKAEYLEDYTDKIMMDESESYARASAATSILNTGSGSHMLPFVNYGSHLQNRFMMGQGLQVATPGLGLWWSGNPSRYPWHVKRLVNNLVNYAVENPDEYPRQFEPMTYALIAKLFPQLSVDDLKEKQDLFIEKLYQVRDKYWQPGGISEDMKEVCLEEMEQHFRREGLERTLMEIGLNPKEANLDNNGAGATFAKWLGAGGRVQRDINEYHKKLDKRMENMDIKQKPDVPDTKIPKPSEEIVVSGVVSPTENRTIH